MGKKPYNQTPRELEGVASTKDVITLEDKLTKCYSADRYEEFQEAVEKIMSRFLKGTVGWAIFLWLITLIASMLLQKTFSLF